MRAVAAAAAAAAATAAGCLTARQVLESPNEVLLIPAALESVIGLNAGRDTAAIDAIPKAAMAIISHLRIDIPAEGGAWVAERTALLPASIAPAGRAAAVTFGGVERGAADVLHVLDADTAGRARAASAVARAAARDSVALILLAPVGLGPRDGATLLDLVAVIADSARAAGVMATGVLAPAADTATFPARALARVTDQIVIRLEPSTFPDRPRALLHPDEARRLLALRAGESGTSRIVALLPLHGVVWKRDSLPRAISYQEARRAAEEWMTELRRDPASGALYARDPARGELWVPDAFSALRLTDEARRIGVRKFAFVFGAGEDRRLWELLAEERSVKRPAAPADTRRESRGAIGRRSSH